jgi:Iap family predicted aminopeptidase
MASLPFGKRRDWPGLGSAQILGVVDRRSGEEGSGDAPGRTPRRGLALACALLALACLPVTPAACREQRPRASAPPLAVGPQVAPGRTPSFASAVATLVGAGYPQSVVEHLTALGDAQSGFRLAGGRADLEQSAFIAGEMRGAGLQNVRLEPVAVDVWDVRGAEVVVGDERLTASQWAGVPGTPADGITAPLVYVRGGLAADYAAVGDVDGCIVLVDFLPSEYWVGIIGMEAKAQGAAGMILTSTRRDTALFADPASLASSSATYSMSAAAPFVYVCRRDGDRLKQQLAAGPVSATMRSDVAVTAVADGGVAYNVVGELPGSAGAEDLLVVGAHQDAFFEGAVDDASGVAGLLTMARAMQESGYRPERTIVFVSHTAEEFGLTDSQYDWCIGSWRLLTAHADWPGRVAAELELDEIGFRSAPLWALNVPELGPWLRASARGGGARLWPQDWITAYSDQWAYSARGIPSVYFGNTTDRYDAAINHTDRDTAALLDYETLGEDVVAVCRAARGLAGVSRRLLPLSPAARARDLAASVAARDLERAGCGAAVQRRYQHALAGFARAAKAYGRRSAPIPTAHFEHVNTGLLAVLRDLGPALSGLDWYDTATYPHRAQLDDVLSLGSGIRRCRLQQRGPALRALAGVTHTATGRHFTYAVYRRFLHRFSPEYERLGWAAWGRLPLPLDVLPEYRLIESGRYRAALRGLVAKRRAARAELERRLAAMTPVLAAAAQRLDGLR